MFNVSNSMPSIADQLPDFCIGFVRRICHPYFFSAIIGFPDATPDDYIATTELIDELKSEGFIGWTFPLLLIPMGGSVIEKEAGFK